MTSLPLNIRTSQRGCVEITQQINALITTHPQAQLCHIFVKHTSASIIITGNEDENILKDIEDYFQTSVADANPNYRHCNEGDFDMSGHIRTLLTGESKSIPILNGALNLGKFQGIFLYEHRTGNNQRHLVVTLL
jgi:secondary thiamine-phosphate synthase enzyme